MLRCALLVAILELMLGSLLCRRTMLRRALLVTLQAICTYQNIA